MTMVSQAAATRMRSSPMRDTTSPSQPRRPRHRRDAGHCPRPLRRASSGSGCRSACRLGDMAGRRARCVVARRAWRDGGRHLAQFGALSAARPAVGSPTLPDDRILARGASGPLEGELHDQLQSFTRREHGQRVRLASQEPSQPLRGMRLRFDGDRSRASRAGRRRCTGTATRRASRPGSRGSGQRSSTGVAGQVRPRCRRAHRPSCPPTAGRTCHATAIGRGELSRFDR